MTTTNTKSFLGTPLWSLACRASDMEAASEILAQLVHYPTMSIRASLVKHPNTSSDTLARLSLDSECEIRLAVLDRPETNFETIVFLASDEDEVVRNRARDVIEQRGLIGILGEDDLSVKEERI